MRTIQLAVACAAVLAMGGPGAGRDHPDRLLRHGHNADAGRHLE